MEWYETKHDLANCVIWKVTNMSLFFSALSHFDFSISLRANVEIREKIQFTFNWLLSFCLTAFFVGSHLDDENQIKFLCNTSDWYVSYGRVCGLCLGHRTCHTLLGFMLLTHFIDINWTTAKIGIWFSFPFWFGFANKTKYSINRFHRSRWRESCLKTRLLLPYNFYIRRIKKYIYGA